MDATVLASLIGGIATLGAALLGQSGAFDALFRGRRYPKLPTEWSSTWLDSNDEKLNEKKEKFFITKQRGSKIQGHILYDTAPDKRWEFEGNFTGRFLQLYYYPSEKADDKLFQDYGCYFFELQGDEFVGYSVGYAYETKIVDAAKHKLVPKK